MLTSQFPANNRQDNPSRIPCLTLPVAPLANSKSRFDSSGSGAPEQALLPAEAASWIGDLIKGGKIIQEVDLKGPGDALTVPDSVLETVDLLKKSYPEIGIRVTGIGLGVSRFAETLAQKEVQRVNIQVDGITPEVIGKIFAWIRPGKKTIPLARVAELLTAEQKEAVTSLHGAGLKVNIQTTVYPGINELQVQSIAEEMASAGADSMTLFPYHPDRPDGDLPPACDDNLLAAVKQQAAVYLEIIDPDGQAIAPPMAGNSPTSGMLPAKPSKERPNVGVVSLNGMDVDVHLGQADRVLIYGPRDDGLACLLASRPVPASGKGTDRWQKLADACLYDCFSLLAANAGEKPQKVLAAQGIKVWITDDNIEGMVDALYGGGKKMKCKKYVESEER